MVDERPSPPQAQAVMWQWQQLRMRKAQRQTKRDNFSNADLDPTVHNVIMLIFILLESRPTKYVVYILQVFLIVIIFYKYCYKNLAILYIMWH